MNKSVFAIAFSALLFAGCAPKIARQPLTETEQQWNDFVKVYYPAWKPQPTVASAFKPAPQLTQLQTPAVSAEPLPQMPPAPQSDLVFEEDVAAFDAAVIPADDDVIKLDNETPAPAEQPADKKTEEKPVGAKPADPAEAAPKTDAAPNAEAPNSIKLPTVYEVQKGDMLGEIARKFYGRASLWPELMKANEEILKGSPTLRPGMKLAIPAL